MRSTQARYKARYIASAPPGGMTLQTTGFRKTRSVMRALAARPSAAERVTLNLHTVGHDLLANKTYEHEGPSASTCRRSLGNADQWSEDWPTGMLCSSPRTKAATAMRRLKSPWC